MTKKDYIVIAEALKQALDMAEELNDVYEYTQRGGVLLAISAITVALQRDNIRFDALKFLKATHGLIGDTAEQHITEQIKGS